MLDRNKCTSQVLKPENLGSRAPSGSLELSMLCVFGSLLYKVGAISRPTPLLGRCRGANEIMEAEGKALQIEKH